MFPRPLTTLLRRYVYYNRGAILGVCVRRGVTVWQPHPTSSPLRPRTPSRGPGLFVSLHQAAICRYALLRSDDHGVDGCGGLNIPRAEPTAARGRPTRVAGSERGSNMRVDACTSQHKNTGLDWDSIESDSIGAATRTQLSGNKTEPAEGQHRSMLLSDTGFWQ